MTSFYLAAGALEVAALIFLLRPWRGWLSDQQTNAATGDDAVLNLNAAVHRDRLAELERDHSNGTLSDKAVVEARAELQRQLIDDTADFRIKQTSSVNPAKPTNSLNRNSVVALCILTPLLAVALYATLGNHAALLSPTEADQRAQADMEQRVAQLARKMEQDPKPEGLMMLARSYKSLGRWDDAVRTFERIGPELDTNAVMLAEFAEALAQQNRGFDGRPRTLIQRALVIEPNAMLALFLAGSDAMESKHYQKAAEYWSKLLPQLEPDSEDARMVMGGIAAAKERAGMTAPRNSPSSSAQEKSVSGQVTLSPALKAKAHPNDVLFIFARAVNGPRMPLAALKARVGDLPLKFKLDDSQAMNPELTISKTPELRIEARISKTGQAMPGAGDLTGKSATVKPGASSVQVVIDEVVE